MCGRFSVGVNVDQLAGEFGFDFSGVEHEPRYNVAPGQDVLAVARGPAGLRAGALRWGLVPHWATDPAVGARMINARSETAATRPSFRMPFRSRRCWVLADGFYEWQRVPGGGKQPYHVRLADGRPFAMAGLWDRWRREDREVVSCTILTTLPNDAVAPLHDRMPVILAAGDRERWLDASATPDALHALLRPYAGALETYPVSPLVGSPANDRPEVRERTGPDPVASSRGG
jgi:putative SOS response-associated peptidase YedK